MQDRKWNSQAGRRAFIRTGLGVAGGLSLPAYVRMALAAEHPPIGTWPAGVQGKEVFIGVAVPRTG
ncbi:MAG TPA: branched-chain amino acid ABC transporter substrate-binding protein, partial [Burkholderiales bacterium]|nr:branched-chain amino acid ABC transporter substrate-binding protein [Burkholderiales bacterium]